MNGKIVVVNGKKHPTVSYKGSSEWYEKRCKFSTRPRHQLLPLFSMKEYVATLRKFYDYVIKKHKPKNYEEYIMFKKREQFNETIMDCFHITHMTTATERELIQTQIDNNEQSMWMAKVSLQEHWDQVQRFQRSKTKSKQHSKTNPKSSSSQERKVETHS